MSLEKKRRYLRESGLEEKILMKIQDEYSANQALENAKIELDLFLIYQVQLASAQEQALAELAGQRLFASTTLEAIQAGQFAERFLVPGEPLSGIDPSFSQNQYSPVSSASEAVSGANQLKEHAGNQQNQLMEGLASKGVTAALIAAGVPAPAAKILGGFLAKQILGQLQQTQELIKKVLAALATAAALLLTLISKLMTALGTAAATALLAGGGFALFGPVGLLAGGIPLAINAISAANAAAAANTAAVSTGSGQLARATQAARPALADAAANFRSATSDLLGKIGNNIRSIFSKEALGNALGIGTASSTPLATTITATTVGLPAVATVLVMSSILASFMIDVSGGKRDVKPDLSRFANITKTASIVELPSCDGKNRCSTPVFPVVVEYQLKIEPKDDFVIEITDFIDESIVIYDRFIHKISYFNNKIIFGFNF